MESSDLAVIGLTCNLVGVFFLANSIIFRRPRKVIEEFFGVGAGSLATIRDYALNKMQVVIGFLFLNAGFLLQMMANWDVLIGQVLFCVGIIGSAVLVYMVGAYYSRRTCKRLLREFFGHHAWSFTENMALTKEIGLFLGIPRTKDMTVEDYVHRVREALGVGEESRAPARTGTDRGRRIRDISPLPGR